MAINGLRANQPAWPIERPLPESAVRRQTVATIDPALGTPAVRPAELRNTIALLVAILLISVVSLLYMTQAAHLATSGYQISQLQARRDALVRDNQTLEVQLSQLRSLPNLEKVATEKLHMTRGDLARVQYVSLDRQRPDQATKP